MGLDCLDLRNAALAALRVRLRFPRPHNLRRTAPYGSLETSDVLRAVDKVGQDADR